MNKKYTIRILILIIFIIFIIVLNFASFRQFFTLEKLQAQRMLLMDQVKSNYFLSVLIFIGVYFLAVATSLPPAFLFTIAGGFLFGTVLGTLYSSIGATLGALIVFWIVRYGFGDFIQNHYGPQLISFNKAVDKHGASFLILIHFVAVVPFFLINLLAGMTKISAWTFIWTTAVGIIPISFIFAFAGSQLHDIKYVSDIFSTKVIGALILIAILSVIPVLFSYGKMPWQKK